MQKFRIVYPMTRRGFLKTASISASALALGPYIVRGQNLNSKLNIAAIGASGKGASDTDGLASENIVALCDIDSIRLEERGKKYPKAKLFADYRKMLEEMKEIDAVHVSTPDHHHAPASMMAMKLGKHVYCQKPLTHSIYEARMLAKAAKEYKVATLMGNQGHSGEGVRQLCALIWSGAIGDVKEVHSWTDRPGGWWKQGLSRPAGSKPVPSNVNWDLFLGPAPERPYHEGYHPFAWRGWWDFGTGALGDMGCHLLDPAQSALKLGHPISVEAEQEGNTAESGPVWSIITYEFPAREGMPPVKLIWYDGAKTPPRELLALDEGEKMPENGSLFIGSKGKLITEVYGENPKLTRDSDLKEIRQVDRVIAPSPGHYQEFILACKGEKTPFMADFEYAGPFTEMVLLGNLAVRTGRKVMWDGPRMKATNVPEASQYVKREYRKGWTL